MENTPVYNQQLKTGDNIKETKLSTTLKTNSRITLNELIEDKIVGKKKGQN